MEKMSKHHHKHIEQPLIKEYYDVLSITITAANATTAITRSKHTEHKSHESQLSQNTNTALTITFIFP